jgi:hypothetical protein
VSSQELSAIIRDNDMRGSKKKENPHWDPKVNDGVLARCQIYMGMSDAALSLTWKLTRPYGRPWLLTKLLPSSVCELSDLQGRVRCQFNKWALQPFLQDQAASNTQAF